MSETVKVIIEIPKKVFEARKMGEISPWVTVQVLDAVQNGSTIDDLKAKIQAERLSEIDTRGKFYNMGLNDAIHVLDNIGKGGWR